MNAAKPNCLLARQNEHELSLEYNELKYSVAFISSTRYKGFHIPPDWSGDMPFL